MIKVIVLKSHGDGKHQYQIGDVYYLSHDRANRLIRDGYVELYSREHSTKREYKRRDMKAES